LGTLARDVNAEVGRFRRGRIQIVERSGQLHGGDLLDATLAVLLREQQLATMQGG